MLAKSNQAPRHADKRTGIWLDELEPPDPGRIPSAARPYDALMVLQRSELVSRMATEVERYVIELGTEGRLDPDAVEETMVGVAWSGFALMRDYAVEDIENVQFMPRNCLPHQDVLDFGRSG